MRKFWSKCEYLNLISNGFESRSLIYLFLRQDIVLCFLLLIVNIFLWKKYYLCVTQTISWLITHFGGKISSSKKNFKLTSSTYNHLVTALALVSIKISHHLMMQRVGLFSLFRQVRIRVAYETCHIHR